MISEEKEDILPEKKFDALMRRCSILILKDMFMGEKKSNDFLEMNPRISGKVLSDQLKNLEKCGYIEKIVVSTTPLKAEYHLTEQGRGLNRVLYELMVFTKTYIVSEEEYEILNENNLKKCFDFEDTTK
ncbi:helix-turn-helix domain-containing protein [Methanolobus sp. ZRKC2]|uniref:winged helix-turn-helix transcriptional regulator n=1 Tax=Methanolobus sp. ZRKC2 TaxID=3125783 RepID=UPI0032512F71